jgi:hypothetical protein
MTEEATPEAVQTPLAVVHDYAQLHQALRDRAHCVGLSRLVLDEAAGLTSGHCSKILAPTPIKTLGMVSLGPLLGALGVQLLVVEDPVALARIAHLPKRDPRCDTAEARRRWAVQKLYSSMGKKGAASRNRKLTAEHRSQIARAAARARWDRASEGAPT